MSLHITAICLIAMQLLLMSGLKADILVPMPIMQLKLLHNELHHPIEYVRIDRRGLIQGPKVTLKQGETQMLDDGRIVDGHLRINVPSLGQFFQLQEEIGGKMQITNCKGKSQSDEADECQQIVWQPKSGTSNNYYALRLKQESWKLWMELESFGENNEPPPAFVFKFTALTG